jgi:hypothetical protein
MVVAAVTDGIGSLIKLRFTRVQRWKAVFLRIVRYLHDNGLPLFRRVALFRCG